MVSQKFVDRSKRSPGQIFVRLNVIELKIDERDSPSFEHRVGTPENFQIKTFGVDF
jgi:hypothetical protein